VASLAHPIRLGITMGDPAGIGPEIVVKALSQPRSNGGAAAIVVGDLELLRRTSERLGATLEWQAVHLLEGGPPPPGVIPVVDHSNSPGNLKMGEVSTEAGQASLDYIGSAVALAQEGQIDAVVTAPICKASIHMAGSPHTGHTEMLASLTQAKSVAMLLVLGSWRILHLSTHVSLSAAVQLVDHDRIMWVTRLGHQALVKMGITQPRIAIAGLNPHAGEGGLMGDEDEEIIAPAVAALKNEGIGAVGPLPADTVFARARTGQFDLVVAMYHDQGHAALKTAAFEPDDSGGWKSVGGVNVTLGLPIVRTSVDHGVAFDIAGKGVARADSLLDAMDVATKMCGVRTV